MNIGPYMVEKWVDSVIYDRWHADEVFANPTPKELKSIEGGWQGYVRSIITDDEVYAWVMDSQNNNHREMAKALGIDIKKTIPSFLQFKGNVVEITFSDSYYGNPDKDLERILNNKYLKKYKIRVYDPREYKTYLYKEQ